ncbi:MAG: hypothetical protein L0287_36635, partial [Anaerolineae bacterium]|nr:hypothetical protein [Anaerolineae bacterium]
REQFVKNFLDSIEDVDDSLFQHLPEVKLVPLAKLINDESYQRVEYPNHTKKIVREFEHDRAMPIVVNERSSNKIATIEGKHTAEALKEKGYTHYWGFFTECESVQDEARKYEQIAKQKKNLTQIEKFKAEITSGHKVATTLQNILEEVGVSPTGRYHKTGEYIRCIGTLKTLAKTNPAQLLEVFKFIQQAWPEDDQRYQKYTFLSVSTFLSRMEKSGKFDYQRAVSRLGKQPLAYFSAGASLGVRKGPQHVNTVMCENMIAEYNKGLRNNRIE